jgi:hypothetical protein
VKRDPLAVHANLRRRGKSILLALCDADLLGRTLKQGKIVFHVREDFYKGSVISLEEAVNLIHQSTIINMVGTEIVETALANGLVHPDAVLEIDGVLHAQIVKL